MIVLSWSLSALAAEWPTGSADAPWSRQPDGLEVQDLVVGSGTAVEEFATAVVHYTGMLGDGTVFDSSLDRDEPFSFQVGQHAVIRGWEEGLIGMRVGGKRRLVIPADLGYGSRAVGPIPPDSVLYFEIDLLDVVAPRKAPAELETPPVDAWRVLADGVRVADVRVGDGDKAKLGRRVCADWIVVVDGAVADDTYPRGRCTWMRLEDQKLPEGWLLAFSKMRAGGVRLVELSPAMAKDPVTHQLPPGPVLVRIELESTGK